MTGSLLTGVFAASNLGGLGLAEGVSIIDQVSVQALAIVVTILWSAVFSYLILKVLDKWIGIRVTADEEQQGLDIIMHEETGYRIYKAIEGKLFKRKRRPFGRLFFAKMPA